MVERIEGIEIRIYGGTDENFAVQGEVKVKVKQSHYRPEVAQRVAGS